MPTITLPITTYSVRQNKPNQKFGSTARLPIQNGESRVYARVPLDKIPQGAVISSAILRFYKAKNAGATRKVRALPVTSGWNSSVRWAKQPSVGAVIDTVSASDPASWDLNVTSWAQGGSRRGLRIDTDGAKHILKGSSAANGWPRLIVTYTIPPDTPGNLRPSGGSVSVAQPVLTFAGDDDMTAFRIDFSTDGTAPSASTPFIPATSGRFEASMAAGVQPVLTDGGAGIWWRAVTDGPTGQSSPSAWAYYEYDSLPAVGFTSPAAVEAEGSPTVEWTVTDQTAYKVDFRNAETGSLVETSGWVSSDTDRFWTPSRGVPVPDGEGYFEVWIKDDVRPRVAASNAPTDAYGKREFTTSLTGSGTPVDSLTLSWDDPVPVLSGVRAAGVPDEVMLVRDGVAVPLWDAADGDVYLGWAPGAAFFTGTSFVVPDFTSDPRHEHTWEVRTRVNGVASTAGPTVTDRLSTGTVWLVNPRTGEKVEVQGYNGEPTIEQATEEQSILHVPINGGPVVEPKRRRIIRTTRAGSVSGVVLNDHEAILEGWALGDSSDKYRLVFGKVNWPVIIGNYSPVDVSYPDACGPDRVLVSLDWWQRLSEV